MVHLRHNEFHFFFIKMELNTPIRSEEVQFASFYELYMNYVTKMGSL